MGKYYATWHYAEDDLHSMTVYAKSMTGAIISVLNIAVEDDKEPERLEIKEVKVNQVHEWAVEYNGKGVTEGMITIEAPDIINAAILAKAQLFGLNIRRISIVEEDENENT